MSEKTFTECPKCRGLLVKETEPLQAGGKVEVIKCVQCGNRVAERPAGAGMERDHAEAQGKQKPGPKPAEVTAAPKAQGRHKKPRGVCPECNRTMAIVARGLCGGCMIRLKAAKTLDEKYPAKKRGAPKGNRNNRPATKRVAEAKPKEETEVESREIEEVEPKEIEVKPKPAKNPPHIDSKEAIREVVESVKGEPVDDVVARHTVADWASLGPRPPGTVTLQFNLSDERDAVLFEKLETAAKFDRRTVADEIMALLEEMIDNAA